MEKKQFNVEHQRFEKEPGYKDVKPADQSADNDIDRLTSADDEAKKSTDDAYMKNKTGNGSAAGSTSKGE